MSISNPNSAECPSCKENLVLSPRLGLELHFNPMCAVCVDTTIIMQELVLFPYYGAK